MYFALSNADEALLQQASSRRWFSSRWWWMCWTATSSRTSRSWTPLSWKSACGRVSEVTTCNCVLEECKVCFLQLAAGCFHDHIASFWCEMEWGPWCCNRLATSDSSLATLEVSSSREAYQQCGSFLHLASSTLTCVAAQHSSYKTSNSMHG